MENNELIKDYIIAKTSIQLTNVKLVKSNFTNLLETQDFQPAMALKYEVKYENEKVYGYLHTSIKGLTPTGELVLEIKVTYKGEYISTTGTDDVKTLLKFAEIQTVPQLIAYARSHISTITSQMLQQPIHLPTMDIIESLSKNKGQ